MEMVTDQPTPAIAPPATPAKTNNLLLGSLALLSLVLVGVSGFLVFQNRQLQQRLSAIEAALPAITPSPTPASGVPTAQPNPTPSLKPLSFTWATYTNKKPNQPAYSINYPEDWRINDTEVDFWVGFGPQQIQEDLLVGVSVKDSEWSVEDEKNAAGSQFPDKQQKTESVTVNDLTGIKLITTTPSLSNWYSEIIIFVIDGRVVSISNGASTDADNAKLPGVPKDFTFADFYNSFTL